MSDSPNMVCTKKMYAAVPAGDAETVMANIDPEVHVTYYGNSDIPYAGDFHGEAGMVDFLTAVGGSVEIVSMDPQIFIEDGELMAVFGHLVFKTAKGGVEFGSDFAHIIEHRNGKWFRFRDFFNSALAADTFRAEA